MILKLLRRLAYTMLPVLLFVLSCLWVLLFPAVSISSGELKPRGLYVDEHALLVQSQLYDEFHYDDNLMNTQTSNESYCEILGSRELQNIQCSTYFNKLILNQPIIQIELYPYQSSIIMDTTVIAVHYNPIITYDGNVTAACEQHRCDVPAEATLMVANLARNLAKDIWNARKIIILLVPNDCTHLISGRFCLSHSSLLEDWLHQYHRNPLEDTLLLPHSTFNRACKENIEETIHGSRSSSSAINGNTYRSSDCADGREGTTILDIGVIREAYVVDLTHQEQLVRECIDCKAMTTGIIKSEESASIWQGMILKTAGINGVLPNMDMVSYPLSVFPKWLQTDSAHCVSKLLKLKQQTQAWDAGQPELGDPLFWLDLFERLHVPLPQGYKTRLLGLYCTIEAHMQGPSGIHAQFNQYNIDSIGLEPHRSSMHVSGPQSENNQKKRKKKNKSKKDYIGLQELTSVIYGLVYFSNNLHEELHHSHFYYLLMGSHHFTGISEYGFMAGLFLMSVLALFVQLAGNVSFSSVAKATRGALGGLLPIIVILLCCQSNSHYDNSNATTIRSASSSRSSGGGGCGGAPHLQLCPRACTNESLESSWWCCCNSAAVSRALPFLWNTAVSYLGDSTDDYVTADAHYADMVPMRLGVTTTTSTSVGTKLLVYVHSAVCIIMIVSAVVAGALHYDAYPSSSSSSSSPLSVEDCEDEVASNPTGISSVRGSVQIAIPPPSSSSSSLLSPPYAVTVPPVPCATNCLVSSSQLQREQQSQHSQHSILAVYVLVLLVLLGAVFAHHFALGLCLAAMLLPSVFTLHFCCLPSVPAGGGVSSASDQVHSSTSHTIRTSSSSSDSNQSIDPTNPTNTNAVQQILSNTAHHFTLFSPWKKLLQICFLLFICLLHSPFGVKCLFHAWHNKEVEVCRSSTSNGFIDENGSRLPDSSGSCITTSSLDYLDRSYYAWIGLGSVVYPCIILANAAVSLAALHVSIALAQLSCTREK